MKKRKVETDGGGEKQGGREESLVPGRRALIELMRHRPNALRRIYCLESLQAAAELKDALAEAERRSVPITRLRREELDELAPGTSHQGVFVSVAPRTPASLAELVERADARNRLLIALDEIHDPQNLGAILRTADACGADGLIVPERRAVHLTPAVRKISAGASEFVPLAVVKNLAQALRELKNAGFWILGSALGPPARSLYDIDPAFPLVVVIGAENEGLRPLTRSLCDYLVEIPMRGSVQSLNASNAAAIILFELQRRRQA